MSEAPYKAPNGEAIAGLLQWDQSAWPIVWPDPAYVDGNDGTKPLDASDRIYAEKPSADWQDRKYGGREVYLDDEGCEWMEHHLIRADAFPLNPSLLAEMAEEVLHRKRAQLFFDIADTFPFDVAKQRSVRRTGNLWIERADKIAFTFGWIARASDPAAPDWTTGDITMMAESPPCEMLAKPARPLPLSEAMSVRVESVFLQKLDALAGVKVKIDQDIADNVRRGRAGFNTTDSTGVVLESITAIIGELINLLQGEAAARENRS